MKILGVLAFGLIGATATTIAGMRLWQTVDWFYSQLQTAFRVKAMKFHPDQNQSNKEAVEAKFKEVLRSYETIKKEGKNNV